MRTTGEPTSPGGCVVLVPVKSFADAKARLAPALDAEGRAALARRMAEHVLAAAAPLPTAVVCDDEEVARWAAALGAAVIEEPGVGLNAAVTAGVAALGAAGAREVIVAHGDIPFAADLAQLAGFDGVTLVPDRREDGTNVVCLPARSAFVFRYGPGSFARHRAEAGRCGLPLRIRRVAALAWDVDVPADLDEASGVLATLPGGGPGAAHVLGR